MLKIDQIEYFPLSRRQVRVITMDERRYCLRIYPRSRIGRIHFAFGPGQRRSAEDSASYCNAFFFDSNTADNSIQPAFDRSFAPVLTDFPEGANEGFLRQVICLIRVIRKRQRPAENNGLICCDEIIEKDCVRRRR